MALYDDYQKVFGKNLADPAVAASLGMTPEQAMPYAANIFSQMSMAPGYQLGPGNQWVPVQQPQTGPTGQPNPSWADLMGQVDQARASNGVQAGVNTTGAPVTNAPGAPMSSADPSGASISGPTGAASAALFPDQNPYGNYGTGYTPGSITDNGLNGPATLNPAILGAPPMIPGQYSDQFSNNYGRLAGDASNAIRDVYNYQTPQAQAAQIALGMVPQTQAQQMGISPELQFLLSGQGFDPATLARMRAEAFDQASAAGTQQMSQAKRALEQAGLTGSAAGAGVQADIARQVGQQQNSLLNQQLIQNAQLGANNRLAGVGYQTQIGQSNMQAANEMALQNANRLFQAMNQNTQNQQQTNLFNTGNENQRLSNEASQRSSFLNNAGQNFLSSMTAKQNNADVNNAANLWDMSKTNAANSNAANQFNVNNQEDRYKQAAAVFGSAGFNPMVG